MTSVAVTDMLLLMLWIYETPISRNREKISFKTQFQTRVPGDAYKTAEIIFARPILQGAVAFPY